MYAQRILQSFLTLTLIALISSPAVAQNGDTDATVSGFKIGVVNIKEIFDSYQKQKDLYVELDKVREALQVDITKMSTDIESDKNAYEENKENMTTDQRRDRVEEIETAFSDYQAEFKKRQDDIARREKRLGEEVLEDINKAIKEIGLKQNYHLVFESTPTSRSGLVYFSSTLNMTQRVIDLLNEQYKKEKP